MSYSKIWYNEKGTQPTYNTYPLITIDGSYVQKHGMSPLGVGPTTAPEPEEGVRGVFLSSGNTIVSSAMVISGGTIGNGYTEHIYKRGKAYDQLVDNGTLRVFQGGLVESTYVKNHFATVCQGGLAKDMIVGSGSASANIYVSGALVGCTMVIKGAVHVRDGGTATNIVGSAGWLQVSEGGVASSVDILQITDVRVFGGTIYDISLHSSGRLYISSGSVYSCVASAIGLHVSSGGYMQDATLYEGGGYIMVNPGARVSNLVLSSGTSAVNFGLVVGGVQQDSYFLNSSGGIVSSFSGGPRILASSYGENLTIMSRSTCRVFAGGSMTSATVLSGGILQVSGGTASEIIIVNGGTIMVSSGASALNITSEAGAKVDSKAGATITYKQ